MKLRLMLGLFFLAGWAAAPFEAQAQFQLYRPAPDKTPIAGKPTIISNSALQVDGKRVVFFGIDPMMPKQPCNVGPRTWDCGSAAQRTLMNLLGREPVECLPQVLDMFRRVYAKCTVNGQDIAAAMVEAGMAVALPEETKDYLAAEQKAKAEKVGIWQGDFMTPAEFREFQTGHPQAR
jgi:endonuclease YncB( thermonuclease family)